MFRLLYINDYRRKEAQDRGFYTRKTHPKIHVFWIKMDDVDYVREALRHLDLGKRKRRRSSKHHKDRVYIDRPKGNIYLRCGWINLPRGQHVSTVAEIIREVQ